MKVIYKKDGVTVTDMGKFFEVRKSGMIIKTFDLIDDALKYVDKFKEAKPTKHANYHTKNKAV